jgi:hypothetical protein
VRRPPRGTGWKDAASGKLEEEDEEEEDEEEEEGRVRCEIWEGVSGEAVRWRRPTV